MDTGELLTRGTACLTVVSYTLGLVLRAAARGRWSWLNYARWTWTGGFAVLLLHVVCAFHFYHDWSHEAAYRATARQTAAVTGLVWGGGLYVNYLFVLVWGADVCWWWCRPGGYQGRCRCIEWTVQGFLAFILFNATVVFGAGPARWLGLAVAVLLAAGLTRAADNSRPVM
jgi:hypothetical protein